MTEGDFRFRFIMRALLLIARRLILGAEKRNVDELKRLEADYLNFITK